MLVVGGWWFADRDVEEEEEEQEERRGRGRGRARRRPSRNCISNNKNRNNSSQSGEQQQQQRTGQRQQPQPQRQRQRQRQRKRKRELQPAALDAIITSCRQSAEWGIRVLKGPWARLRSELTTLPNERLLLLANIVRLANVRTRLMRINQIGTVLDRELAPHHGDHQHAAAATTLACRSSSRSCTCRTSDEQRRCCRQSLLFNMTRCLPGGNWPCCSSFHLAVGHGAPC